MGHLSKEKMATKEETGETGDISSSKEASVLEKGDIGPAEGNERIITVVLAGKREIGKSTLINKLLRLAPDKEADTGTSTEPTTTEVTVYSEKVDDIELKVVDIPGLGIEAQSDSERHDIMAQIIAKTNKEADILLYCASMNQGCQIDDTDVEILRLLRMVFGKDLFQHCILVNTFANTMRTEEKIEGRAEGIAEHFKGALKKGGIPGIQVRAIQHCHDEAYKGILNIPAGCKEDDLILPNWRSTLLQEMVKKVGDHTYTPYPMKIKGYKEAMLMKYLHLTGIMDRMEEKKLKDGVGPTMRLERANTKKEVKEKLKEKERIK